MTNYFQDRLDELSKATLTRTADAAKERGKMAQIASDTSDREEDKEWHQKHADRFKRVGAKAIEKASTKNEDVELDEAFTYQQKLTSLRVHPKSSADPRNLGKIPTTGHDKDLSNDDHYKQALADAHAKGKEIFGDGKYDVVHTDQRQHTIRGGSVAKVRKAMQSSAPKNESVELDENYKKHSTLANIYDKEIGHFKDAAHRKGMATSAIQAHTRSLNTAPNDAKKEYHKKRIDQYKTILKESEELSEVSDAKKREYLDAAVDSHHQGFTGRTPMSKDKMAKRRAMIQKVAQKVTGQKHYSDMDGKPYNASTGKKYNEEVELDEGWKHKLAAGAIAATMAASSHAGLGHEFVKGMVGGATSSAISSHVHKEQNKSDEEFAKKIPHEEDRKAYSTHLEKVKKARADRFSTPEYSGAHAVKERMFQKFKKELADKHNIKESIENVELDESFTDAQIAKLKSSYAGISTIDPDSDGYRKLTALLDKQDVATLKKLADAKIKFVSGLALNRYNRKKPKNEGVELDEKTLTPAELKKREEVAKVMEKDQPGIDKSKKMAIATAVAKRVAESQSLEEATFIDDTHPHYEKMMKEFGAKVAKIKPNEKAHVGNFSHGNNVYQSTMASKTKTGKVRFWHTKD